LYDYIFPAIAQQVPQAKFVFLLDRASFHGKFHKLLKRAFEEYNLESEDYCHILPRQDWDNYISLNLVSDVFLDTLGWSGCHTTLDAIACKLPVVTFPGEFMRGRQSYAILKRLEVTETIASDEEEYIEIAVRLGKDREWRSSIVEKISQRHEYLYDDKTCVAALEDFYQSVVRGNYL
jgi:predicted O-linked N-acetylglucosamine transferase (SPINDLY family)